MRWPSAFVRFANEKRLHVRRFSSRLGSEHECNIAHRYVSIHKSERIVMSARVSEAVVPHRSTSEVLADHWTVELLPARIIRCTRLARQYGSAAEAEQVLAALNEQLPGDTRHAYSILLDARATPALAQDPAIDAVIVRYRKLLFEGFAAAAILVKTATGTMQVWRQAKHDGVTYRVFNKEDAVLEYLAHALHADSRA